MVTIFDGNDANYINWIKGHPNAFIINTPRGTPTSYMVLHRASCRLVWQYNNMARPGGFTERQYIKVCSENLDNLKDWVRKKGRKDGSFSKRCNACNPTY
jgi:hypothetical protein